MNKYHIEIGKNNRCAIKVDFLKAYDMVDWEFLLEILKIIEVHLKFVGQIKECITTSSFSISINGELQGYSKAQEELGKEI